MSGGNSSSGGPNNGYDREEDVRVIPVNPSPYHHNSSNNNNNGYYIPPINPLNPNNPQHTHSNANSLMQTYQYPPYSHGGGIGEAHQSPPKNNLASNEGRYILSKSPSSKYLDHQQHHAYDRPSSHHRDRDRGRLDRSAVNNDYDRYEKYDRYNYQAEDYHSRPGERGGSGRYTPSKSGAGRSPSGQSKLRSRPATAYERGKKKKSVRRGGGHGSGGSAGLYGAGAKINTTLHIYGRDRDRDRDYSHRPSTSRSQRERSRERERERDRDDEYYTRPVPPLPTKLLLQRLRAARGWDERLSLMQIGQAWHSESQTPAQAPQATRRAEYDSSSLYSSPSQARLQQQRGGHKNSNYKSNQAGLERNVFTDVLHYDTATVSSPSSPVKQPSPHHPHQRQHHSPVSASQSPPSSSSTGSARTRAIQARIAQERAQERAAGAGAVRTHSRSHSRDLSNQADAIIAANLKRFNNNNDTSSLTDSSSLKSSSGHGGDAHVNMSGTNSSLNSQQVGLAKDVQLEELSPDALRSRARALLSLADRLQSS